MILRYAFLFLLLILSFESMAGRIIQSVTLSPNPAVVNTTVSASISVLGTGFNNDRRWRSTGYRINGGAEFCEDHQNFESSSSRTTSFDLNNIGNTPATYQIDFIAYRDNSCGGGSSNTYSADLTVVTELFDISLSPDTIFDTDASLNAVIGDLQLVDATDAVITGNIRLHSYNGGTVSGSCAAGAGDNWRFRISNNVLSIVNAGGSTLAVGEYTICVRTGDLNYRENLTIKVEENLAGITTDILLSNDTIGTYRAYEGTEIGELTVVDPNNSSAVVLHNYNGGTTAGNCAAGTDDNWRFGITNNRLSITNDSNSTLAPGEYTICVKTNDNYFRKNLIIYVNDSSGYLYFDRFSEESYSNNDGELDWSTDWQEYGDDGRANSGDVEIINERLHLVGNYSFIYREVDLSSYTEASLSLDYELITNSSNDDVYILIRMDDSATWNILHTFDGGSDYAGSLSSIDISDYISSNTTVGIYTTEGFDNNDDVYIDNFGINATGLIEPEHIYFDRFNSISYSNNDGEFNWSSNWSENNDDNSPSNGKITIVDDELKITGSNVSISREADLSAYSALTLSFSYRSLTSYSDDIVYLQIRSSNGTWYTLEEFVGSSSSNASGDVSIDITSYISNDVDFRFITSSGFDNSDAFYVDNFAIDNSLAGSCPDISSYELIFHDDFSEDVHQLNETWSADNFDRSSTNVWPNDAIYTSRNEELDIVFDINNGHLQIAGDVSNKGNSEYGVLLHDVNGQGYSSNSIQQYSIETSISAYASEVGNNDVGIVFGYQNENDFYLLRWTKIGVGYATDPYFPGVYRSLDLLWVKDGSPTLLASQPDFYSNDPMSVRITVDADGISICINGNDVLSYANAQPNMHSVGFFSYDNDYENGLQIGDFKIYCRECEAEGIIGWWPMEDSLDDLVGVNDLSEIGDVDFGSSNIARTVGNNSTCKYAIMDGSSYGRVDDSGHLNSEELTVSAWVYPKSYPGDANDINGNEFGGLMSISSKDENYEFHINSSGKLYWWWRNENSTARTLTSNNIVPLNTWSHVAISYKAGEQKMYINGILERSSSWNEVPKQSSCDYFVGADVSTGSCSVISERTFIGELDEVRIYGRYLSENEIKVDMDRLRECGLINEVDHYRITHPQNNLSCAGTSLTVQACGDENCSAVQSGDVSGFLQYTLGSDTTTISALNLTNTPQQVDFDYTSLNTIVLGLNSMSPYAGVQCFYNTGEPSSCDITYTPFGYLVTASDITSSETISDNTDFKNRVEVQAVEAIENNPAVCQPALVGSQQVDIDFSYINHPANYDAEPLNVSVNDSSYTAVTSGNGLIQTLNFDNPDAKAYFYVRYGDAGTLQLSVSDPNGAVITGYDNFNVVPNSIQLVMDDGVNALGVAGNETHYAGQSFNLTIQALNADGKVTNNYRPGNLELAPQILGSMLNSVSFDYGGSSLMTFENTEAWENAPSLVFNNNGYTSNVAKFDNVGNFIVDVKDSNYLGYEISSNGDTNAGRFTPAYFIFENSPDTTINDSHGTFTYFGESLDFDIPPTFTYAAKTYENKLATNYIFVTTDFDFISNSYIEKDNDGISYDPVPYPSSGVANTDLSEQGKLKFTLESPFLYEKSATLTEPLVSTITLSFSADELKDADNIGYDSSGIENDLPSYESFTAFDNTFNLRYGRLFLENAFGSENSDLKIEMVLQYYKDGRFVTNLEDSQTEFADFIVDITEDEEATSYLSRIDGSLFLDGKTGDNEGLFIEAPGSIVELLVEITNLPDYLNIDWDGDGVITINDKVSSTIIFGSYRGNDRIIYKRER